MHTCEQHWALTWHGLPNGMQPCPHTPFWQLCAQHSAFTWHGPPFGVQGCPQKPFWQLCEQHSALLPQASPLTLHPPLLELCVLALELLLIMPPMPEALDTPVPCAPELCALEPPEPVLEGKRSTRPPQPDPNAASTVKLEIMSPTTAERHPIGRVFVMLSSSSLQGIVPGTSLSRARVIVADLRAAVPLSSAWAPPPPQGSRMRSSRSSTHAASHAPTEPALA